MPSKGMNKEMGDRHEEHLIAVLGGKQAAGSGNQWHSPMDGRHNRYTDRWAFAWDGKSTTAASLSVSIKMWEKAQEQAGGEHPMLALRFYPTTRPTVLNTDGVDLACLDLLDLSALLADARGRGAVLSDLEALLDQAGSHYTDDYSSIAADLESGIKQILERYK